VLLSRGNGELSDMICAIDGGLYSHGAVWTGKRVVHATLGGIVYGDVAMECKEQQYVDVYRFSRGGKPLGTDGWPAEPVVERAESFVGGCYAYTDLIMVAVLIGYGRRPQIPVMEIIVRRIGARLADTLAEWFRSKRQGAPSSTAPTATAVSIDPKTCTELVGTAFYEAKSLPPHAYALEVLLAGRKTSTRSGNASDPTDLEVEYGMLAAGFRDLLRRELPAVDTGQRTRAGLVDTFDASATTRGPMSPRTVIAGGRALPLSSLTPWDLQTSPTLFCVGRLTCSGS
jgi:hypothetical protein